MAIYDTRRSSSIPVSTLVASALVRAVYAIVDWSNSRRTLKALSRLSDHELRDIGLTRGDIVHHSSRF